jgi:heme A synthase
MTQQTAIETAKEPVDSASAPSPRLPVSLSPCLDVSLSPDRVPAWLRVWAVLTACAALPLVTLGAEVTTKQVGMVDTRGFRAPWHLFTMPREQLTAGYLIEHGHRLAGFVVGMACIVLALGLTVQARGRLHRSLGWVALAAVSLQGLLGIFRVNLHALMGSSLALVHGCCAQLVFATLVAVAVMCSRAWTQEQDGFQVRATVRRWSVGLCLLVYVQVIFGAMLRHWTDPVAQRLHVLLAFAVVVAVFWLVSRLRMGLSQRQMDVNAKPQATGGRVVTLGYVLMAFVMVQPIFGVEAWIRRFGTTELPELVPSSVGLDVARSGHHVLGTLIFATTVALAVMLRRPAEESQARRLCNGTPEATA